MPIEIVPSSPVAVELAKKPNVKLTRIEYPFDDLEIGTSFKLPKDEANIQSLRVICSRKNKKGPKQFALIEHDATNPPCIEVARIK